ncbi:hypothetical protein GW17_00061785 [Ensete ventricosum]|nr:hypothetical protein GW17_00061785 [Ensete ventricosum]
MRLRRIKASPEVRRLAISASRVSFILPYSSLSLIKFVNNPNTPAMVPIGTNGGGCRCPESYFSDWGGPPPQKPPTPRPSRNKYAQQNALDRSDPGDAWQRFFAKSPALNS